MKNILKLAIFNLVLVIAQTNLQAMQEEDGHQEKKRCVRDDQEASQQSSLMLSKKRENNQIYTVENLLNPNELSRTRTKKLLDQGHRLNLDVIDEQGNTLLHKAVMKGSYELVNLLIHQGVSIYTPNKNQQSPINIARAKKYTDIEMLLQANLDLFIHAGKGNLKEIKSTLKSGAYVNVKSDSKAIPLHFANSAPVAQFLLSRGASINEEDDGNKTPLMEAIFRGSVKVIDCLLDNKASIATKDNTQSTPLHMAVFAKKNSLSIMEKLLAADSKKLCLNEQDENGNTPLHLASSTRNTEEIRNLLIRAGADRSIINNNGRTADKLFQEAQYVDLAALSEEEDDEEED